MKIRVSHVLALPISSSALEAAQADGDPEVRKSVRLALNQIRLAHG